MLPQTRSFDSDKKIIGALQSGTTPSENVEAIKITDKKDKAREETNSSLRKSEEKII
jgi:hypothetical protein